MLDEQEGYREFEFQNNKQNIAHIIVIKRQGQSIELVDANRGTVTMHVGYFLEWFNRNFKNKNLENRKGSYLELQYNNNDSNIIVRDYQLKP
jgi:hypothetical protein